MALCACEIVLRYFITVLARVMREERAVKRECEFLRLKKFFMRFIRNDLNYCCWLFLQWLLNAWLSCPLSEVMVLSVLADNRQEIYPKVPI